MQPEALRMRLEILEERLRELDVVETRLKIHIGLMTAIQASDKCECYSVALSIHSAMVPCCSCKGSRCHACCVVTKTLGLGTSSSNIPTLSGRGVCHQRSPPHAPQAAWLSCTCLCCGEGTIMFRGCVPLRNI